jgi:hypothetical protein
MQVLCVKGTKRLVKGCIYEVESISNLRLHHQQRFYPMVKIKGIASFTINNFKLPDGSELPKINWTDPNIITFKSDYNSILNISIGDVVVFKSNDSRTLVNGNKYRVVDIKRTDARNVYRAIDIKVDGNNRWVKSYNFRVCSDQEKRELSINILFDSNTEELKVTKKRKIDNFIGEEKDNILLKILFDAMNDRYRNNMTILEWAINKSGYIYNLNKDDFKEILDKKVGDFIK